jgi:hypothetical protein
MARRKRQAPTSIRLSPDAVGYIETLQAATGWSVSRVLQFCVEVEQQVAKENRTGLSLLRNLRAETIQSHAAIRKAEAITAEARSSVRKAAAAAKGAK